MEYHRNPSPPDSPTTGTGTAQSHDVTITSSTNDAHSCIPSDIASHEKSANDSVSLVDYDDRIGDTVFSKAWVLSLLVKAVEAVREQESKIETLNHSVGECGMEESELNIDNRQNVASNRTTQIDAHSRGDYQIMGMESLECDQSDERDTPLQDAPSEQFQSDSLAEAGSRDATSDARIEDQKDVDSKKSIEQNSFIQRTEKESMIFESSPADSEGEREGERGGGGGGGSDGSDEGGRGRLVDREDVPVLGGVEEISEGLENDLCRLWDASMNMVCCK